MHSQQSLSFYYTSRGFAKFICICAAKYGHVMKELFHNPVILKHFLCDVLEILPEDVRSMCLMNSFLRKRFQKQKQGILDVLVELNHNIKINIELQVKVLDAWDRRQIFYLAKLYTSDLKSGEHYERLHPCIGISILDFDLTDEEEYHRVYRFRDKKGNDFSDILELHIIELSKKLNGEAVDDWIRFFNVKSEEQLKMIQTKNSGIQEAIRELRRMSMSHPLRVLYEAHQKKIRDEKAWKSYILREGKAQGIAQGIAQGKAQGIASMIIELLEEHGKVPEELKRKISQERDIEQLRRWHRAAAKCSSLEEFQRNFHELDASDKI